MSSSRKYVINSNSLVVQMFSKKHKRFGSAPFSRKDWISSSVSLELGHYIHLARAITRARASIILCLWYWVALYNGFFFFTLKKGHIPETFAFFLTFETLYTFIFLYRVSPYHLFFLFNIHLLAVKLLTYFRSPTVSPPSESFPYPPFQSM